MALNIKDAETDRLFRRYARKHSTSFTGAIKLAVGNAPRQEGEVVARSGGAVVAAPTAFEFQLVVKKRAGSAGINRAIRLLAIEPFEIVPWTPDPMPVATTALLRFGGRPARLKYGDCMAYALAKSLDVPLLYKGGDFASTDIRPALAG